MNPSLLAKASIENLTLANGLHEGWTTFQSQDDLQLCLEEFKVNLSTQIGRSSMVWDFTTLRKRLTPFRTGSLVILVSYVLIEASQK